MLPQRCCKSAAVLLWATGPALYIIYSWRYDCHLPRMQDVQAQLKLLARALRLAQECAAACELGDEQRQALQTWIGGLRLPLGSQQRAGFAGVLQALAAGACPAAVLLHAAISADKLLREGSSSSPNAPAQAAAAVGRALASVLGSALKALARPDTAGPENHSQAYWKVRNILSSLSVSEDQRSSHLSLPISTLLDQYVAEWRDSAWTQLQQHIAAASDSGALHSSTLQLLELMATLQGGSSPACEPPQHDPATTEQGRAQSLLLDMAGEPGRHLAPHFASFRAPCSRAHHSRSASQSLMLCVPGERCQGSPAEQHGPALWVLLWRDLHAMLLPTASKLPSFGEAHPTRSVFQCLWLLSAGAQPLTWEGWQPSKAAGQAGADQRLLLLKVRTAALVQPLWQGLQVETRQLDSLQGAQQLCTQLLGQAHSGEQLEALLRLLGPVWDYGRQWEAAHLQVVYSGSSAGTCCVVAPGISCLALCKLAIVHPCCVDSQWEAAQLQVGGCCLREAPVVWKGREAACACARLQQLLGHATAAQAQV